MRSLLAELVLVLELVLVACVQMNPRLENIDRILEDSVRIFSYRKYEAPELAPLAGLGETDPMDVEWNEKTRNSDLDVNTIPEVDKNGSNCTLADKELPKPAETPEPPKPAETPEPPKPAETPEPPKPENVKNATTEHNLAPELRVMPDVNKPELRQSPQKISYQTNQPAVQYIPFLMTAPIPVPMSGRK